MKYEFHVGDYVETKDGAVGFITEVGITCAIPYFTWIASDGVKTCQRMYIKSAGEVEPILSNRYNRLGKYDFTKPEQPKEIEKLETVARENVWNERSGGWLYVQQCKINELVDAVNELRKAE